MLPDPNLQPLFQVKPAIAAAAGPGVGEGTRQQDGHLHHWQGP